MDNELELTARLDAVIFYNEQNHYFVGAFYQVGEFLSFTATGNLVAPEEDQIYVLKGNYVTHPRYGKQFQITSAKKTITRSK